MNQCLKCQSPTPSKFCSRSCAASYNNAARGPRSDETKQKIADAVKANPTGVIIDQSKRWVKQKKDRPVEVCAECGAEYKKRRVDRNANYCSRACSSKHMHFPNSTRVHRHIYKGVQLDSGAEYAFVLLLEANNIVWEKNTKKSFPFTDAEGRERRYYPDFYLPEFDFWVEIKGKRYIRPDDERRRAAVGDNIELIMSHELRLPKCVA